jgi:hypothetical protein
MDYLLTWRNSVLSSREILLGDEDGSAWSQRFIAGSVLMMGFVSQILNFKSQIRCLPKAGGIASLCLPCINFIHLPDRIIGRNWIFSQLLTRRVYEKLVAGYSPFLSAFGGVARVLPWAITSCFLL